MHSREFGMRKAKLAHMGGLAFNVAGRKAAKR